MPVLDQQVIIIDTESEEDSLPSNQAASDSKAPIELTLQNQQQRLRRQALLDFPSFFEAPRILQRCDYLCDALETLFEIHRTDPKWRQILHEFFSVCPKSILFIDRQFYRHDLASTIDRGDDSDVYSRCWTSLLSHLREENNCQCPYIATKFISCNIEHLKQIADKVWFDQSVSDRFEESPMFSEDSFSPAVYQQKQREKQLSKYSLASLNTNKPVEQMQIRIQKLRNSAHQQKLLANLATILPP